MIASNEGGAQPGAPQPGSPAASARHLNALARRMKKFGTVRVGRYKLSELHVKLAFLGALVLWQLLHFGFLTLVWAATAAVLWVASTILAMYLIYLSVFTKVNFDLQNMRFDLEVDSHEDMPDLDSRVDAHFDDPDVD